MFKRIGYVIGSISKKREDGFAKGEDVQNTLHVTGFMIQEREPEECRYALLIGTRDLARTYADA